MRPVLNLTWEYPPWVIGRLSEELRTLLPPVAEAVPLIIVVRGDSDGVVIDGKIRIYKVAESVRDSPHILAYAYSLNIDLIRGASRAIHDGGGVSLIHTHDWVSSLAGVYLSDYFKVPLIITAYTTETMRAQRVASLLSMGIFDVEKYCFSRADVLLTVSGAARDSLTKDYGINAGKIRVLGEGDEGGGRGEVSTGMGGGGGVGSISGNRSGSGSGSGSRSRSRSSELLDIYRGVAGTDARTYD